MQLSTSRLGRIASTSVRSLEWAQRLVVSNFDRAVGSTQFKDEDLVFLMPVFGDQEIAYEAVRRLRAFYPGSRVIVLSDGDYNFPGKQFVKRFEVEYIVGDNLYGIEHGGAMVHRMLAAYMQRPAKFFVRLDTDARVDRRFRYVPRKEGLHGCPSVRSRTISGGCIMLSHNAAAELYRSEIFLSARLLDFKSTWAKYSSPENLQRNIEQKRVSYDKVLHWGCKEQQVGISRYLEIFSVWKPRPDIHERLLNKNAEAAIVHPDVAVVKQRGASAGNVPPVNT